MGSPIRRTAAAAASRWRTGRTIRPVTGASMHFGPSSWRIRFSPMGSKPHPDEVVLRDAGRGEGTLVVAISSRALFDLGESHALFEREGVDAFARYQIAREDE